MRVAVDFGDDKLNKVHDNASHYDGNPPEPSNPVAVEASRQALDTANTALLDAIGYNFEAVQTKGHQLEDLFKHRTEAPFSFNIFVDEGYYKSEEFKKWLLTNGPDNRYFRPVMHEKMPGVSEIINFNVDFSAVYPPSGNCIDSLRDMSIYLPGNIIERWEDGSYGWLEIYHLYISQKINVGNTESRDDAERRLLETEAIKGMFARELNIDVDDLDTKRELLGKAYKGEKKF